MAVTKSDPLRDFLAAEAAHGGEPCHVIVLRWYQAVTGVDCSGLAPDETKAEQVGVYRGMLRVCRCLKLPETEQPQRGDVGLFRAGDLLMAGIFLGNGWVARTAHGVGVYRQAKAHRAWRLA